MTRPYHCGRAEGILAEIETTNALCNETETALAIRAQAHATLALAAATAIDPDRQREECDFPTMEITIGPPNKTGGHGHSQRPNAAERVYAPPVSGTPNWSEALDSRGGAADGAHVHLPAQAPAW